MNISFKVRTFLVIILLSGCSSLIMASAEENDATAPEATAAEAEMSFWDIPYLEAAFIDTAPTDRQDGIVVGKLGVDGGDEAMIVKLAEEIASGQHGELDSLLIAHKNKLLFESYFRRGRVDLPHGQASATKTYTSLALGRAIELGYLTMADLNKPLISFFDELDSTRFADGVELITLHKALTMSTGIHISEEQWEEIEEEPGKVKSQQHLQAMLERTTPITPESQSFVYGTGPGLVMQVIEAVVPGSAEDFIKTELLDKMGITNYSWQTHINGLPEAGWRVSMTSRDMVKWGTLIANNGKWNGEQLVSEAFVRQATRRIVREAEDENFSDRGSVFDTAYGYFTWQAYLSTGDKRYFSEAARGGGGQYIIVIDSLDLVIAVTAHDRDDDTSSLVGGRILPAFVEAVTASTIDGKPKAPEATIAEAQGSFRDIPTLETAFIDPAPAARVDGLLVGALSADGRNPDQIIKLAQEMGVRQHGNYDSTLISHKGKLVFESYFLRGRVDLLNEQSSAAKSFTSLALGRAIQIGYLTMADLDRPLISFFDELDPTKFAEGVERITLHNALNMTTGIRISQEKSAEIEAVPDEIQGQKHVQAILEHTEPITADTQTYLYNGAGLVMHVIEAVVPGSAEDFIKNELLDKLGITKYRWNTHANGLPEAGWRVGIIPRDMMKWGALILNDGKLDGEQLISAEYLGRATSGLTQTTAEWQPDTYRYGYFMYQTNLIVGNQIYDAAFAWGGGGQYIIVIQELDLIITITGHDGEDAIMQQVSESILPTFVK